MASPSLIAEAASGTTRRRAGTRRSDQRPGQRARERRRNLWIYVFLLPTFVLYGMYTLYPMVASYWYSLVEWNGFTAHQEFVGLSNYRKVFADPLFWNSVKVTFIFMLIVAPLRVFGAFFLAILLNSPKLPFTGFFRTVYFIPVVTTTAIVGVVMRFIFDPASGPVAGVLGLFGAGPVDLLGSSDRALLTAGIVYVWKFFGITLIYWLAALQTIPQDLYEAARIDGADPIGVFRDITLPMLVPFLLIISVLTIEDCFHAFDLMQTMTAGGPFYSTEIVEIYIYRFAFAASIPQLGHASAAAVLFGVLVLLVVILQAWGDRGLASMGGTSMSATQASPTRRPRMRTHRHLRWWLGAGVLAVVAFVWVYPFLWMLSASLKTSGEVFAGGLNLLPEALKWENYSRAWEDGNFKVYLLNTVIVTFATVVIVVVRCALAGYVLGRYKFPGSRVIIGILVATLFVPTGYTIIPIVKLSLELGLLDEHAGMILALAGGANVASILIYAGYFRGLPAELEEAAIVDGAGFFRTFMRIMLPLSMPVTATVAILTFLFTWNAFFLPLVFSFSNPALRTVSVGMQAFVGENSTDWPGMAAAGVISMLPIVVLYAFMQRYFVEGIAGAVKS